MSDFKSLLEKGNSVTVHQHNIQALTPEIYKTLNNLNPTLMNEIFYLKQHNYHTRKQNLEYPNPRTVTYGLETFGYKACQIWSNIPYEIQYAKDVSTFKSYISKHSGNICKCNLCKTLHCKSGLCRKQSSIQTTIACQSLPCIYFKMSDIIVFNRLRF